MSTGNPSARNAHVFIGGGIASLSGAAILIRDHGIAGSDITILEAGHTPGGSLDGSQTAEGAFVVRGARMLEENYLCTFNLMDSIPLPGRPGETLASDFRRFNEEHKVPHSCLSIGQGGVGQAPGYHLPRRDMFTLFRMLWDRESRLDGKRICDVLGRDFFDTEMWLILSTTLAFQPWHSAIEFQRYLRRFLHHAQGHERLNNMMATRYNQQESLIDPLRDWLIDRGVQVQTGAHVTDAMFEETPGGTRRVSALTVNGTVLPVAPENRVYFTLGSMTDGARLSRNGDAPPAPSGAAPSFDLWHRLARAAPGFGRPEVFAQDERLTGWLSFTLTLPQGGLGDHLARLRPNGTGETVIYALDGSPWRAALVPFIQPHFRNQPPGSEVVWGYGLRPDRTGTHCGTRMHDASGTDLITEIANHLGMDPASRDRIFDKASVVSCRMPLITSQFMPRRQGDRPDVRPRGAANYACMGQFVEIPFDTVFTVEYSVRTAWEAVNQLNPGGRALPATPRPDRDLRVLKNVARHLLSRVA